MLRRSRKIAGVTFKQQLACCLATQAERRSILQRVGQAIEANLRYPLDKTQKSELVVAINNIAPTKEARSHLRASSLFWKSGSLPAGDSLMGITEHQYLATTGAEAKLK